MSSIDTILYYIFHVFQAAPANAAVFRHYHLRAGMNPGRSLGSGGVGRHRPGYPGNARGDAHRHFRRPGRDFRRSEAKTADCQGWVFLRSGGTAKAGYSGRITASSSAGKLTCIGAIRFALPLRGFLHHALQGYMAEAVIQILHLHQHKRCCFRIRPGSFSRLPFCSFCFQVPPLESFENYLHSRGDDGICPNSEAGNQHVYKKPGCIE